MIAQWVAAAGLLGAAVAGAAQPPPTLVLSQLSWYSRSGMPLEKVGPVADHGNFEISPDGSKVAVAVVDQSTRTRDLWIYDVKGGARTRFTSDTAEENWMIWSPDGRRVASIPSCPAGRACSSPRRRPHP